MSENPSVEVATSHWLRVGDEKICDTLLAAAAHFILQVYPDEHLLWEASIVCEQDDDESSETAALFRIPNPSGGERSSAFPPNRCRFRKNYDYSTRHLSKDILFICDNER